MAELDPNRKLIDCIFFYGASNVQKAGRVLQVIYPRTTVFHGAEHVVSLFFKGITKLAVVKNQILRHCFIYGVFGSGSMHLLPYALFHKATKEFHNGRDIALIRAADTWTAGYFMAMHRDLRLKPVLHATVKSAGYISNTKIAKSKDPNETIKHEMEWRRVLFLLEATYSAQLVFHLT
jgi:hypothetical protein